LRSGFGASVLWTAQGSYLAKNSDDLTLGFHSGVFFGLFFINAIVGNLMAAIFIHVLHFKPVILIIVLFVISAVAALSFLLLRKPLFESEKKAEFNLTKDFSQTLMLFRELKMLMLLPVIIYSGFSQSYFTSRITQQMGEDLIGFVMCAFGVTDTVASVVMGKLSDKVGRKPVLIFSTLVGLTGYTLSFWADQERPWLFFIIMACLGCSDAGYNTQLQAVMGIFQPEKLEASYAFLKLVQSSSTGIAFVYTLFLNLEQVTYIAGGSMVIAIAAFVCCDLFVAKVDGKR